MQRLVPTPLTTQGTPLLVGTVADVEEKIHELDPLREVGARAAASAGATTMTLICS